VGSPAPEVKAAEWLNSVPLSLAQLTKKIVVVEFWATWCPPCRKSIPHLIELNAKYKDKGVVIMGLTDEPMSKVKGFAANMKMDYAVGVGSPTGDAYGVTGIPHAFVVAPGGKIVWSGHPADGLDKAIEDALKKTPPTKYTVEMTTFDTGSQQQGCPCHTYARVRAAQTLSSSIRAATFTPKAAPMGASSSGLAFWTFRNAARHCSTPAFVIFPSGWRHGPTGMPSPAIRVLIGTGLRNLSSTVTVLPFGNAR
jgi:thiol-disulfide isomerase/thioredoxin